MPAFRADVSGGESVYGVNVQLAQGHVYDVVLEYMDDAKEPVGVQVRFPQTIPAVLRP